MKKTETIRALKFSDIPKEVKQFMPPFQQDIIIGSVEHWDIIKNLQEIINKTLETYGTEKIETPKKIVYLHYFFGGSDWYIIEKDIEEEQLQAYGYVVLNGNTDFAEWGYINIEELKDTCKVELDFFWIPKPFEEINA